MEIKCSVEELKQLSRSFILTEKQEIKIDGTKVGQQIVPSATNAFKESRFY